MNFVLLYTKYFRQMRIILFLPVSENQNLHSRITHCKPLPKGTGLGLLVTRLDLSYEGSAVQRGISTSISTKIQAIHVPVIISYIFAAIQLLITPKNFCFYLSNKLVQIWLNNMNIFVGIIVNKLLMDTAAKSFLCSLAVIYLIHQV